MIKLQSKLPRDVYVACSGGVDSMAAVDFLSNNHNVTICFFNHRTDTSDEAHEFISWYCNKTATPLLLGVLNKERPKESKTV